MSARIKKLCTDFYSSSTLHGLHYVFDSNWKIRKTIWFILLGVSLGSFAYTVFEGYVKWEKHETYVSTKYIEKEIKFPSITLCNYNMLKWSKIKGKDGQLYLDGQNAKFSPMLSKIYSQMNSTFDIEDEVRTNGHKARDIIKDIMYSKQCFDITNRINTTFDLQTGMCHTININRNVGELGKAYGLDLLLDTESHEYYGPYVWQGAAIKLAVHEPDVYPTMEVDSIDIPTGFTTNIRIKKKEQENNIGPPYSNCGQKELQTFKKYTRPHCRLEKFAAVVSEKCGCRFLGAPLIGKNKLDYCHVKELPCAFNTLFYTKVSDKECPKNCSIVSYSMQTSTLVYPTKTELRDLYLHKTRFCNGDEYDFASEFNQTRMEDESFSEWFRGRYARVTIYFTSQYVEISEIKAAYDGLDFFGNLGGNMGFYLGCSVLTVIEFVDFAVVIMIQLAKGKHIDPGISKN